MKTKLLWLAVLFPWLLASALLWLLASAGSATFMVNSPADATDALPGDGLCETVPGNNICTLRAAVQESNALAGVDTILLPAGSYTLTIAGQGENGAASGDLDITEGVMVSGAGRETTTVDGGGLDRVFHVLVPAAAVVHLSGVTIREGDPGFDTGGGIFVQTGQLALSDSRLEDNFAGEGGGIYNAAVLTVTGSIINNNTAPEGGGLLNGTMGRLLIVNSLVISNAAGHGGGLYLQGDFGFFPVTAVMSTTIENNGATFGGGIYALQSRFRLEGSRLNANTAGGAGGGIYAASAVLTVTETTIANNVVNSPSGNGGGISANGSTVTLFNDTIHNNMVMDPDSDGGGLNIFGWSTIVNTTFSGNRASRGGAIRFGIGQHAITNTTIVSNTAVAGGGLYDDPIYSGSTALYNTIVANNSSANCANNGQINSAGYNLESGDSCNFNALGDLINTDPLLGALQDNGGPTWTHALAAGSPAIDAAGDEGCPPTDQRGVSRPVDGDGDDDPICDIGAYEFDGSPPPTPTPTTPTPSATPTLAPTSTPLPTATPTSEPLKPALYLPVVMDGTG